MRLSGLFLIVCALALAIASPTSTLAQTTDRGKLQAEIESLRNRLKASEREFLSPSAEDRAAFAQFLAAPDTGLIRLLPRPGEAEAKLSIRGDGAYYSFTRLTTEYGYGSDIELGQGSFSVGFAGADYGFLVLLGDMPLESVTLDTPPVGFLASLKSPSTITEARAQYRQSADGIKQDGTVYAKRVGALAGYTYALRSVNCDRSDVLVAFRVVRKDTDGSLIILWKMLKQFPAPTLVRDEK